jgi:phage shock protein C
MSLREQAAGLMEIPDTRIRAMPDAPAPVRGTPWSHHLTPSEGRDLLMNAVHASLARQGLVRPRDGRMIAGVCAGLARRFGLDPWIARLLFVLILFVVPGSQILIYPVLWLVMPNEEPAWQSPEPTTF